MMKFASRATLARTAAAVALLTLLSGCVTSRSVVELKDTTPAAGAATATVDAAAPTVKLVSVDDQRVFQIDPPKPELPSLTDDDIHNKAITDRAIARKRNTYGHAMGDVLLPAGDTVSAHVTRALTQGFQQAGYRVLASNDAGYDKAVPVTAAIKEYWCWAMPGFFEAKMSCVAAIDLTSALPPLSPLRTLRVEKWIGVQIGLDSDWRQLNEQTLQEIAVRMAAFLKGKS